MKQLNTHDFEDVYKELAISIDNLGCIMLDVEPLKYMTLKEQGMLNLPPYISKNKERPWIKGWVADKTSHVTLLYGLLQSGKILRPLVDRVLDGWSIPEIEIDHIGFFDSPYKDEPYYCLVAHIKVTPLLLEGHQRLEFLPHINTFAGYKPHVTIAYINKSFGEKNRDAAIARYNKLWSGKKMKVKKQFNYGGFDK